MIMQIDSLQEIELVKIADIKSLNFSEHMSDLEKMTLRSLPEQDAVQRRNKSMCVMVQ